MTLAADPTVTRLLDTAIEDMFAAGLEPARVYLGHNQLISLLAEVEYFGGFRVDATVDVRKRTYKGMEIIPVAMDNHLFVASTGPFGPQ